MGSIGGEGLYVVWQSVVDYSSDSSVLLEISTSVREPTMPLKNRVPHQKKNKNKRE